MQWNYILLFSNSFVNSLLGLMPTMRIHGQIDADSPHPEEDAPLLGLKLRDSLHRSCKSLGEAVFRQLGNGKSGQNGLSIEDIAVPFVEGAEGLGIACTQPF